jgi:two-component system, NarL family, nitrate/nitrite response regulator NarL
VVLFLNSAQRGEKQMSMGNLSPGNLRDIHQSNRTLKTYVAHRSPAVLERLTAILAKIPGVEIVGQSSNAGGALDSLRQLNPEVLIMDAYLLGRKGLETIKVIKVQKPAAVAIILADMDYPQYRRRFYNAGAEIVLDISHEFMRLDEFLRELTCAHC